MIINQLSQADQNYLKESIRKHSFGLNEENFENVCWADNSHCLILKKGTLTLWNLDNIQSVYSLSESWKSLSFSWDRTAFILKTVNGIDCYETLTGKLLDNIPVD